jgi:DNA processing protein
MNAGVLTPASETGSTDDEQLHWLALKLLPGLGTRRAVQLIERYRTPQAIFRASVSELEGEGVSASVARSIASGCTFEEAVDQRQRMLDYGAVLLPLTDSRYPARLREIFDPPLVLFARGRLALLETLILGVVGTRAPTAYGVAATERLAADLAHAGLTIASGMARGIDTAAHRAVLSHGGDTIAVFGCGVDGVYPAENRKLAEEISSKGLLVSEYPMSTPAYPQNFPVRNRIISGMSIGVLVVEGAQYSGSAITAKMAMEQQREVFAVPGSIMSKMSWGPNLLIKQGAKLVQDWNDVVVELSADDRRALIGKAQARQAVLGLSGEGERDTMNANGGAEISPIARKLLNTLRPDTPAHLDLLLETFEAYSSSETIAALFELEMAGLARQLPGKNFVRVW